MKSIFDRVGLMRLLATAALLSAGLVQSSVHAQRFDDLLGWDFMFGFVPGQKARINVVVGGTGNTLALVDPLSAELTLFNAAGEEIHKSARIDVPNGGFATIDVDRSQLAEIGDVSTHRLQVRGKLMLYDPGGRTVSDGTSNTIAFGEWKTHVSVEIIDTSNGQTSALLPAVQLAREPGRPRSGAMGLPLNHRIVFSAYIADAGDAESIGWKMQLWAANGRLLVESAEVLIQPGHFETIIVDRSDVPVPCESDCRAEVHPVWALAIHVKDDPTGAGGANELFATTSSEIVDNRTGATGALHGELHLRWSGG